MNKFIYIAAFAIALIGAPAMAAAIDVDSWIVVVEDTAEVSVESIVEPATEAATLRRMKIKCPIRPNTENNTVDADGELCIPFYRSLLMGTVQGVQTTSPFTEVDERRYTD